MTHDGLQTGEKYLVTVADDLGRSASVNEAIAEAHDNGILTAASLMAGGEAFQGAIQIALKRRHLSVGLHATFCDGRPVLPPSRIPALVGPDGCLKKNPAVAGLRYIRPGLFPQIEAEIEAQFNRIEEAGIHPSHVDGHHHLHIHPVIFEMLCRQASRRGVSWIRIPREPLSAVLSLHSRFWGILSFVEWMVFRMLGVCNLRTARRHGLSVADSVFGLSRTERIDEKYLCDILNHAKGSLNEIFTHPDTATGAGRLELEALTSSRVRERLDSLGIALVGYQDLSEKNVTVNSALERL